MKRVDGRQNGQIFVAKKVLMGRLDDKEQQSAMLEVKLLKQFKHPHIVAYEENFIEDGILIIIMEYCEGSSRRNPPGFS